jgi:hypothetical protein
LLLIDRADSEVYDFHIICCLNDICCISIIMAKGANVGLNVLVNQTDVEQTAAAISARGIKVAVVETGAEALAHIQQLIPAGAQINTGGSKTLKDIGLEDLLVSKSHQWHNLKDAVLAEQDRSKQGDLRRKSSLAEYYLGSVQAVAQTGELVIASAMGNQIAAYAFTSPNVVWVVGAQKIVPSLAEAITRVREYAMQQEDVRMKSLGHPGTMLGKLMIFEREAPQLGRNVNLILVKEAVGV